MVHTRKFFPAYLNILQDKTFHAYCPQMSKMFSSEKEGGNQADSSQKLNHHTVFLTWCYDVNCDWSQQH